MADVVDGPASLDDVLAEQPESADPTYVAWKRQKIETVLRRDAAHPEGRRPVDDVFNALYRRLNRED
jgi:hypothetical protein